MPRIKAAAANQLFLGDRRDTTTTAMRSTPDPARLFTPITPAQFASISAMSTFRPKAENDNLSFTTDTSSLFSLPAGDVGFAGVFEYGSQSYRINPDPLALTADAYYGPRYGDGHGDRDHWDAAGELRVPLLSSLQASVAGRYDRYSYGGQSPGKFTWSAAWNGVRSIRCWCAAPTAPASARRTCTICSLATTTTARPPRTTTTAARTSPASATASVTTTAAGTSARIDSTRQQEPEGGNQQVVHCRLRLVADRRPRFRVDYYKIRVANQVQTQDRELLRITEADCRSASPRRGP
jgi:hypothetical protein